MDDDNEDNATELLTSLVKNIWMMKMMMTTHKGDIIVDTTNE